MEVAPDKSAGLMFLLPTLMFGEGWYLYLFVATPETLSNWQSARDILYFTFSNENDAVAWFVWFAVLPMLCAGLALAYLLGVARRSQGGAWVLFASTMLLDLVTLFLNSYQGAILVALPGFWGYRALHAA